jgi:hypothetical protein
VYIFTGCEWQRKKILIYKKRRIKSKGNGWSKCNFMCYKSQ